MAADIMLTLLPVLVVFVLGQKYIVGGVAAGSCERLTERRKDL